MSISISYPFTTPSNYVYDSDKVEILGGEASLKLTDLPNQDFNEDFADDTGFAYDSDKAEFTGGQVQQKSQAPANATLGASFTSDVNGNWGDGTLTGTPVGGASISGNRLDLAQNDIRYVDYDADSNADAQQTLAIKGKYTFPYTGAAPAANELFLITKESGSQLNLIRLYHTGTLLFWQIFDQAGSPIVSQAETFSPVADTTYEIELNIDLNTGATRLFINGTQLGTTHTGTGTRDANIGLLRIGSDRSGIQKSNLYLEDFIVFSAVQHTTNYTPGYTVAEYKYAATNVTCPEMEYTGVGTLQAVTAFATTDTNAPRYTLQIGRSGDYLYWNGSAWDTSDGTYAQANDEATFNANVGDLDISGEIYGQFKVLFDDNNDAQMSVADLTCTVTGQTYPTDNPTITFNATFRAEGIDSFTETSTKTGSDEIKYPLKKGNTPYYYSGSAWAESDGTYAQANTAAEIEANKATFTDIGVVVTVQMFLHSDDGTTTPSGDVVTIEYDFSGTDPDTVDTCIVYGYSVDSEGSALTEDITIRLTETAAIYKDNTQISGDTVTVTPDSQGYWEAELVENENMSGTVQYIFNINNQEFTRTVPDEATKSFNDLS